MSDKLTIYAKNNLPGVSRGRRNYGLAKGGSVDIHTIDGKLVAAVADPEKLTEAQRAEIALVLEQEQKRNAPKAAPAPENQPTQPTV